MACLNFLLYEFDSYDQTEKANEMTTATDLAKLTEKVEGHIKLFTIVVSFGFVWLGVVSWVLWGIHGQLGNVEKAQANTPAQIVASLLNSPVTTVDEAQANLAAAASVLQSSKVGKVKPDSAKLRLISDKLEDDQNQYPGLPQVWATTGAFINYKFQALLPSATEISASVSSATCKRSGTMPGNFQFENCDISLEDVASQISGNKVNGQLVPIRFVHCILRYSGGNLPDEPLEIQNSLLIIQVTVVPPRKAIDAMRQLAQASVVEHITLNG